MVRVALAALFLAAILRAEGEAKKARIALYVAIDKYEDTSIKTLRGCVNDMTYLAKVLEVCYGFETFRILQDREATQEGIRQAFLWLIEEVEQARKQGKEDLVVVFAHAGHGGVLESKDSREKYDQTIVPSDGTKKGKRHIRDDDINRVLGRLQDLGVTVVYVRDSCHSGSAYRSADFTTHRSVVEAGDTVADVDEPSLFPDLPTRKNDRLVYLGAVNDAGLAEEGFDAHGMYCGKFSLTLTRVLSLPGQGRTYEELYRKVRQKFAADWPDSVQKPTFAIGSPSLAITACFGDQQAPLHARIRGRAEGRTVTLTLGRVHGVTEGAEFRVYGSLEDLAERTRSLAVATVGSVGDLECTATLDRDLPDSARADAVARLDAVRFRDFRVGALTELPPDYLAVLADLGVTPVAEGEPYDLGLMVRQGSMRAYLPERLPGAGAEDVHLFEVTSARGLEEVLGPYARVHRLQALARNEGDMEVSLQPHVGHGADRVDEIDVQEGPRRFRMAGKNGPALDIVVRNPLSHPVDVFVFYEERSLAEPHVSSFALFFPDGAGHENRIEPRAELVLRPPEQAYYAWPTAHKEGARYAIKLLFTHTDPPYSATAFAHLNRTTGVRADADDLQRYLADLGAGKASRSPGAAAKGWWATASLVFDVVQDTR